MKHSSIIKTVYTSLFASLIFIGTQFIRVPLTIGYFNLGDTFVLSAGYFIGGIWGALASAIGSGLADILSGYAIYAPATVIIKALMALVIWLLCKSKKRHGIYILGACLAETVMVLGYLLFDTLIYGLATAIISMSGNILQGIAAIITSTTIVFLLDRTKIFDRLKK